MSNSEKTQLRAEGFRLALQMLTQSLKAQQDQVDKNGLMAWLLAHDDLAEDLVRPFN